MVFDLVYLGDLDLTRAPLRQRRKRLELVVTGSERIFPVRRLAANGLEAWAQMLERGYEGYVAKDDASRYIGGKTRAWLKVKVPGWTDPEDRWRRTTFDE
jgi:bifunctional non-homologous end joining protein LigD